MTSATGEFFVACLCAEWCGTCREYRPGFETLASQFPEMVFRWVDIEDESDALGDLDVENFPTLLIQRGNLVLYLGIMLPQHGLLKRLLESFQAQTADESARYAGGNPERLAWQTEVNLRAVLGHPWPA